MPFADKLELALPVVYRAAHVFPMLRHAPFALVQFAAMTTDALAIVQLFAAFGVAGSRRCRQAKTESKADEGVVQ